MRRFWACLAVLAVLVFASVSRAADSEPQLVRLSFSSGWDALPSIVAIERGFFAQEGLVVSGLAVSSADAVINSLTVGSTDFAAIPQRTLLVMAANGAPIKVVSMNGWGPLMELVVPATDIRTGSIGDLKGKTIGLGKGSEAYPIFLRLLNQAKLRPSDVKIKLMDATELVKAFAFDHRQADAVFESRYFTEALTQNRGARVVLSDADMRKALGAIDAQPLVVRKELVEKQAREVQKFVNAWVKALKYIQQEPDDCARLLQVFFHRQGVAVKSPVVRAWVDITHYNRYTWTAADIADAEYNAWALKEAKITKQIPKLATYVDNTYGEKAVAAIK